MGGDLVIFLIDGGTTTPNLPIMKNPVAQNFLTQSECFVSQFIITLKPTE